MGVPASLFLDEEALPIPGAQKRTRPAGLLNDEARLLMHFRRITSKKLKHGFIEMLEDVANMASGQLESSFEVNEMNINTFGVS